MITVKDVAKRAGVGIGTVSRVLNKSGYVSREVEEKINAAILELGYVPNQIARNFKSQRSNIVALFVPTVYHPFFSKLTYYVEEALYARGYKTLLVNSQGHKEKEKKLLGMIRQNQVEGIIFVTHHTHDDLDISLPIVSIDRHLADGLPYVTSDNYGGARLAVEHLLARGCERVGFLGGATAVRSEVELRAKAYRDVMAERGLPSRMLVEQFQHGEEMEVTRRYLEQYPEVDGLFLGSDLLANSAYHNAVLAGRRVPEELKIVGFDGVLGEWSQHPQITTVCQNVQRMAAVVVETLLKRVGGEACETRTVIPVELRTGETT